MLGGDLGRGKEAVAMVGAAFRARRVLNRAARNPTHATTPLLTDSAYASAALKLGISLSAATISKKVGAAPPSPVRATNDMSSV